MCGGIGSAQTPLRREKIALRAAWLENISSRRRVDVAGQNVDHCGDALHRLAADFVILNRDHFDQQVGALLPATAAVLRRLVAIDGQGIVAVGRRCNAGRGRLPRRERLVLGRCDWPSALDGARRCVRQSIRPSHRAADLVGKLSSRAGGRLVLIPLGRGLRRASVGDAAGEGLIRQGGVLAADRYGIFRRLDSARFW